MKTVSIVIPTLNEEEGIAEVINAIPVRILRDQGYDPDIVIVDGRSTDRTVEIARSLGARILYDERKGKGMAIESAFKQVHSDYVIMLDGDNTYPPAHVPEILECLKYYEVVLGSRLSGRIDKGAITRLNLAGNHMLTWLANRLYKSNITDLCTGYWGFRGYVTNQIRIYAAGFDLEANIFTECVKHGFTIGEIPIHYRVRKSISKLRPSDGIMIAESLVLNAGDLISVAGSMWMRKMYSKHLISGKSLRKRNVKMNEAFSVKLGTYGKK
ncbi:hypothetical protein CUJ83_05930 [Methanocella sp. CWC-04]|uniref:Glycosyltransferase 2-like domain-containing protein n=1 Tax=Methanooceanicella nereidis TaxID=2052831 RepID=A0AAP2W6R4_9EURY|nr:glycosyltransferase family 2 protein [Methanocella sp. CWC-04]MCD1294539.1 hypothetical protein [Methanocella sp. CWC-04]